MFKKIYTLYFLVSNSTVEMNEHHFHSVKSWKLKQITSTNDVIKCLITNSPTVFVQPKN